MEFETQPEGEEKLERFRKMRLVDVGLSYSLGAGLVVILSFFLSICFALFDKDATEGVALYINYILPQLAFLGAAIFYLCRTKESFQQILKPCHWSYFLIAILLQYGLLFSLSALNNLFIEFFEHFGYTSSDVPLPPLNGWNLVPAILTIALLPAIFEEILFRGIISRGLHAGGWGLVWVCLVSGALFSLYHGNPEQTVYQFLCGCCFALMAVRAGSILPTMLSHFLNNALILCLTASGRDLSALPSWVSLSIMLTSGACLIGSLIFLMKFDRHGNQQGRILYAKKFFLAAGVGILICTIEWIAALLMGFIHG